MTVAARPGQGPILMLSPVMPDETGSGIAQRAGVQLRALASLGPVHLLVIPVLETPPKPSALAAQHAARIGRLDLAGLIDPHAALIARLRDPAARRDAWLQYPRPYLTRFGTSAGAAAVAAWCGSERYAALHVQRLYLAPFLEALRRALPGVPTVLDLDDDEALTRQRIADLHRANGDEQLTLFEDTEARKFADLARRELPRFSRVLVCSEQDARRLADAHPGARFAIVPNAAPHIPEPVMRPERPGTTVRLLFVGTMGYLPNEDAARYLCRSVLPALRAGTRRKLRVDIVGPGGPERLADLADDASVHLHGWVRDLASVYAAADVAVAPIRAGGGTRIKILEAFARHVPVVATHLGAEGLDVVDGTHLRLADDPASFAHACLDIATRPERGTQLAANAAALVRDRHGVEKVAERLRAVYADLGFRRA